MNPNKTIITFSVRRNADDLTLEDVGSKVASALGCQLVHEQGHDGVDVLTAELLGMTVRLSLWQSSEGPAFQMHGSWPWSTAEAPELIDLSQSIIDLLAEKGDDRWRIPTREDLVAEADWRDTVDRETW